MAFVTAVAAYGQKLRGDKYLGDFGWTGVRSLAGDQRGYVREEFLQTRRTGREQERELVRYLEAKRLDLHGWCGGASKSVPFTLPVVQVQLNRPANAPVGVIAAPSSQSPTLAFASARALAQFSDERSIRKFIANRVGRRLTHRAKSLLPRHSHRSVKPTPRLRAAQSCLILPQHTAASQTGADGPA